MRLRTLFATAILTLAVAAQADAQPNKYPPAVFNRGVMMSNLCKSMGGKVVNGAKPFLYNSYDLNGDGILDWVLDAGNFACAGKPNLFKSPGGATLEVFISDARGGAASAFIGTVKSFRLIDGRPAKLFVTQSAGEKQLLWNAGTKKFAPGAPQTGAVAQAGAPPSAGAGGFSGPAFTISAADKTAAFKAAGFKQTKRGWQRCSDEEGATSPSYSAGVAEAKDLNNDGRPELWIREGGAICYGNSGGLHIIATKTSAGQWVILLDTITDPTFLNTKHNGWTDIMDGGPGMGPWGTWQFNGQKYVGKRP